MERRQVMNIDLKDSDYAELMSYQIALNTVILNCNEQLTRIKAKLEKVKKESEEK